MNISHTKALAPSPSPVLQHPEIRINGLAFGYCVCALSTNWSCGSRWASLRRFFSGGHTLYRGPAWGQGEEVELGAESSAAGGGVGTRTVVSRGGEEAAVALTATKIGFSFAASLVLLDIGEGRIGGQQLSFRHPCGHFHKGWGLMCVGGLNRLNLIWG